MRKGKILIVGLICFSILIFSGVGTAQKKLEVWTYGGRLVKMWRMFAPEYTKLHPDVKIDVIHMASHSLIDKLTICFQTGIGAPDIADVEPNGMWLIGPKEKIPLLDLTPYIKEQNLDADFPGVWKKGMKDGRYYYAQGEINATFLSYRKDIFEQAGLPSEPEEVEKYISTWDKFIEVGKKLTKDLDRDGIIDRYMLEIDATTSYAYLDRIQWFSQLGGSYFKKDGSQNINSPESIKALQFEKDLITKYKIAKDPGVYVKDAARFTSMNKGHVVAVVNFGWYQSWIEDHCPGLEGRWGSVLLPAFEEGGRRSAAFPVGLGVIIPKQTKYPDLAWDFLYFTYYKPENRLRTYKENVWNTLPPIKSILEKPAFHTYSSYWDQKIGELQLRALEKYPPQYSSPWLKTAMELVSEAIYEAVHGGKTPKEALDAAASKLERIMR